MPRRRIRNIVLLLAGLAVLTAAFRHDRAGDDADPFEFTRFAMDTFVTYTIYADSHAEALAAMIDAHEEIERVSRLLWEKGDESTVRAINEGRYRGDSRETDQFLARLGTYLHESDGLFNPTIGAVLDLYRFDAEEPVVPDASVIRSFLPVDSVWAPGPDSRLTVGGVAKGYAVDRAVAVLRVHNIRSALVNAGGDLYALGTNNGRPWTIGVRHPDDPNRLIDTLHVTNTAVATSGDYQRFFECGGVRYHHLLDPSTGLPARRSRSATVLAPTAEQADALATAAFIAGPDAGIRMLRKAGREGMIVGPDLADHETPGYRVLGTVWTGGGSTEAEPPVGARNAALIDG